jgi:hypothetical protein
MTLNTDRRLAVLKALKGSKVTHIARCGIFRPGSRAITSRYTGVLCPL